MTDPQTAYSAPINDLMALGKPKSFGIWFDYSSIGITAEHVSDLLDMMMDIDYYTSDDEIQVWIPLHAWRALAQLRVIEIVLPLAHLLRLTSDDDWLLSDTVTIVQMLGSNALQMWFHVLDFCESYGGTEDAIPIVEGLRKVAKKYPEARRPVIEDMTRRLMHHSKNDEGYNGFLVVGLVELRAKNALPVIAAAYEDDAVDELCEHWTGVVKTFRLPPDSQPADYV